MKHPPPLSVVAALDTAPHQRPAPLTAPRAAPGLSAGATAGYLGDELGHLPVEESWAIQRAAWRMVRSRWYILPTFLLPGLLMIGGFLCGIELYGTRYNPMLPRGVLAVGGVVLGLAAGIVVLVPIYRLAMRPMIWAVAPHLCASCGYNLTSNTSGVCPECGRPARKGSP